ncbi:MAG: sodium:proton antiporter [Candidatus Rokuibacteriota bacterium]
MNYPYWIAVGLLMLGLYTMIAHRNLMKKFVGMTIFQTSIILFFILTSVKRRGTLPILEPGVTDSAAYMNPLPHALMLTAIVVMVATAGVALAILIRLHALCGSMEEHAIEKGLASAEGGGGPVEAG